MPAFRMPDIGEGLTEAEIVEWFVEVGDEITVGQTVVEVETAKTTVEIPSPYAGTLTARAGDAGDTIEVDDVLFVIDGDDQQQAGSSVAVDTGGSAGSAESAPPVASAARPAGLKAVPAVRKLAKDLGVDLATVTGSGPNGAITRDDVKAAAVGTGVAHATEMATELSRVRRAIAEHMTESWTTIPHVTVQAEVRSEALVAGLRSGRSIEAQVAAAVLPLLHEFPAFNGRYEDHNLITRTHLLLGDEVGIDVAAHVAKTMRDAFGERMEGPDIMDALIADGRKGRKNGRGFYTYDKGERGGVDESVYAVMGLGERTPVPKAEIQERIALSFINEAARCLEEGILRSARDGDIGAVFGVGYPPFRGGPFFTVDAMGADRVVESLERLAADHGTRFEPAQILRDHAAEGKTFRS